MSVCGSNLTAEAITLPRPMLIEQSNEQMCARCERLVASRTTIVLPTPCPPGGLLAIGEAPGVEEDELGEGFVGQAGRVLDALLAGQGLERNRDYGVANIVRCRLPNDKPSRAEIDNCLPWLAGFLLQCRPRLLLLVGAVATEAFLGRLPLLAHIEQYRRSPVLLVKNANPRLQMALRELHGLVDGVMAVPMPHTSGMAWNRKAPDGRCWREWGAEQVAHAAKLFWRDRR